MATFPDPKSSFATSLALVRSAETLQRLVRPPIQPFDSSTIEAIERARADFGSLFDGVTVQAAEFQRAYEANSIVATANKVANALRDLQRSTSLIAGLNDSANQLKTLLAESQLVVALRHAELSKLIDSQVDFAQIGRAFSIGRRDYNNVLKLHGRLSSAYDGFYQSVSGSAADVFTMPVDQLVTPASEYFNAVDLLQITTGVAVDADVEAERDALRRDVAEEQSDALMAVLVARHPELRLMLLGARSAFEKRAPDYVRHCCTSYRELFTQVLHLGAPDQELKQWSTSTADFAENGRPTRRARLRYIGRKLEARLQAFIEADIPEMLAMIDAFNRETHEPRPGIDHMTLQAITVRAEGSLRLLLQISE